MSSAAQPSGFELAVAEGLLSALPQSPLALETARKFLKDDGLSLEEVEAQLRALIDAPKPCEACGAELEESAGACPNCGHVVEADTVADYPQQQPRPRPKRRRKRKAEPDDLAEATVTLNAIDAGGHVTGVPTAWGGVNPAVATAPLPLEAYPGVSTPPNLREADGWERCGNCVFFFKGCNLYGVDRPAANVVHGFQYPVHYSDICDSHASLTPLEDRVTEARAQLAEAVAAGDTERVVRLRARVKVLDEGIFSELLHPRSPKGRVGGGQFAAKIGALKPGESLKVGKVTVKHKPGKPAGASLTGHETKPHYRVEGPGIEGFSHHIAHTPEEAARLATVAAQPRKKSKRATGRAQAARPRVALQEVSSRVYPGLDRSPKENWVDKAGGLPSYIERIAKHLHYEKGMTISHAIAVGVNTVKKWCAGGKGNTSAATKAKACAAVAEWEAKKAKSKAKTATKSIAETVEAEARRDGVWRYPSVEEAERIVEGAEQMDDVYPALGSELELPRYVNRVAGHLHSRGKSPGEAVAIALSTARAVAEGDAGAKTLREEARAAADEYEARAVGWALELVEAVEWTTREGERLGGPTPPSEGFIRKLHTEIAQADGPRWWEGMAEADARELEEAGGLHVLKRAGEGLIDFDPKKHPRAAKGRKGGGRFVDVLGKMDTAAKAGRANPPIGGEPFKRGERVKMKAHTGLNVAGEVWQVEKRDDEYGGWHVKLRGGKWWKASDLEHENAGRGIPVTGGLKISPAALEGIIGDALKVGNEKAVDNYISKVNEKWGAPWETIRPALLKVVEDTRALRAGAAASHGEDRGRANQPIDFASHLLGLGPGKHEIHADGVPFTLYYDEQGAVGDSGSSVRGDKTGEWEVFKGHGEPLGPAIARVHVAPHGSSGYGNAAAPRYAAEQVAQAITKEARKKGGRENEPIDDSWKGFVAQMNGERAKVGRETQSIGDPSSPGRGPSGKLRNFKAMNEGKLSGVISDLANYGPGDQEALNAAVAAAHEKGMSVPSVETPAAAPAPAAAAPGGELSIDHAIGSVLQSHGDDLKDWHLSGPAPVNGQKRWTLDVELKTGQKHSILIGEDGTVELAPSTGGVAPFTELEKSKAKAAVVEIMDAQPKPHAQHSAAAQHVQAIGTEDLQPTGEEESPYHMTDGTYYKGADGKTYQKIASGPKLVMSKKGPIAGIHVKNIDLGTEKDIPAFAVSSHYYPILAPGGGGYQGDIADTPTPDEPTGDVYELLKKSIAGESGTVFGAGAGTGSVGEVEASDFAGKKIVITGAIPGMTRKEAGEALAAHGATLQSSVTKATDYLITGENVGQTKTQAAEKKGVTVIHYVDIEHLLESAVVDDAARLAWVELELSEAGSTEELVRLRARRDALRRRLDEGIFNRLLHPRAAKGRKGGGQFALKPYSGSNPELAEPGYDPDATYKPGRLGRKGKWVPDMVVNEDYKLGSKKLKMVKEEHGGYTKFRLEDPEGMVHARGERGHVGRMWAENDAAYQAVYGVGRPDRPGRVAKTDLKISDARRRKMGRENIPTDAEYLKERLSREAQAGGWTKAPLRPGDKGYDRDFSRRLTSRARPPRKLGRLGEALAELDEEARNG